MFNKVSTTPAQCWPVDWGSRGRQSEGGLAGPTGPTCPTGRAAPLPPAGFQLTPAPSCTHLNTGNGL